MSNVDKVVTDQNPSTQAQSRPNDDIAAAISSCSYEDDAS
jgi:hypothetical protein